MMKFLRSVPVSVLFAFSSLFALIFAYVAEFGFHIYPCKLCIYQRILYWVVLMLSIFVTKRPSVYAHYVLMLLYIVNAFVACYHIGLEIGIFSDILGCASNGTFEGIDSMKKELLDPDSMNVSCGTPQFVFLGISMAGWNLLYLMAWMFIIYKVGLSNDEKKQA